MKNVKGILVTLCAPMENHIANGGEKLLGNASSIKVRPDGKVYISGQMQRHALFRAIEELNNDDPQKGDTFVSNGDGISNQVEKDIRADLGGFLHPKEGKYSGRRSSAVSVTPAVSIEESAIGRDMLIRLKNNVTGERVYSDGYIQTNQAEDDTKQAIATREFSLRDMMLMNFHLDLTTMSISKRFKYERGHHVNTDYVKHVSDDERKRRVRLFLEATRSMQDYAQQARNATSGEPQSVLIVFDSKLSRKASRFFQASEQEKKNIIRELDERSVFYVLGDDNTEKSVAMAYKEALRELEKSTLYNYGIEDTDVRSFAEGFTI